MITSPLFLGIDAGSVSVSIVLLDHEYNIREIRHALHKGKIRETMTGLLSEWEDYSIAGAGAAGSTLTKSKFITIHDSQVCIISSSRSFFSQIGSLLYVGGEKFFLTRFDSMGKYRKTQSNTSCASGTGGFLDQQSKRLGLADSSELSRMALQNRGETPRIASRCSVFAKTDLIHAQQEGYSISEICDGLCSGMADNLRDTLFSDTGFRTPVIFTGGVAHNRSVVNHLQKKLGCDILRHPNPQAAGAHGAAQLSQSLYSERSESRAISMKELLSDLNSAKENKKYYFPPLELRHSRYPDFGGVDHKEYIPKLTGNPTVIETDLYIKADEKKEISVYLGVDIGSTSTKAVILDRRSRIIAGFYTRTAGQPISAFRGILEALNDLEKRMEIDFSILGAATTGSGRKFIGNLIGADLILDEISAHARAAYELNPEIDTIIEIGGQDSKFTSMSSGMVTFSQMNTVCAAGTGSFIEEQAAQLGVPLDRYAARAMSARAPRASDRCTVFMERDIHHYLNLDYGVDEILAAVLYSVRDNYLQKVASTGSLGDNICFQGATARNKALIAAFEEKLNKPIHVSPFCHLTGAMGAALTLKEEQILKTSAFRGKMLFKESIPIRQEQCNLCRNHCRIRIAYVGGETTAFGFLCGRDYDTKKFIKKRRQDSIIESRKEISRHIFSTENGGERKKEGAGNPEKAEIGIPLVLQLAEELYLWETFFRELSIPYITSRDVKEPVKTGKTLAGAEFCTPIHSLYGHIKYLSEKCRYIFLPHYLEKEREKGAVHSKRIRKYCYYTQYAPTLVSTIENIGSNNRLIRPVVQNNHDNSRIIRELTLHLNNALDTEYSQWEIEIAYNRAKKLYDEYHLKLMHSFTPPEKGEDIKVALLGRPYTLLDGNLNNGIPGILADLNIQSFFMDQIPPADYEESELGELLSAFHWNYASQALRATLQCARTAGLYPVLVTSFKCSPDSFLIEYYKRIMNQYKKPYLILQLDDHDSSLGYETRIEAAVRSFRNHIRKETPPVLWQGWKENSYSPRLSRDLKNKTIFLPNWDPMAIPLIAACLTKMGYTTRVLKETDEAIRESMSINTGQCLPVNVIAHEYMKTIKEENLNPEKTILWMIKCQWACNIHLYPYYIKSLLESRGLEAASIFWGDIAYTEFSPQMSIRAYFVYLLTGILRKLGCSLRPYEKEIGSVDRQIETAMEILLDVFIQSGSYQEAALRISGLFDSIEIIPRRKPKVAVFGDLYTRDNPVINQNLIRFIEEKGGEAVITPYNDYVKIIAGACFERWRKEKRYGDFIKFRSILTVMELMEKRLCKPFDQMLGKPFSSLNSSGAAELEVYSITTEQEGETLENILKITHILREHPDITLLVQANPAFCCASLVTEAMGQKIEEITGVPLVSLTYDGTGIPQNEVITPYLNFAATE